MTKKVSNLNCSTCITKECLFSEHVSEEAQNQLNLSRNSIKYNKGQYIFHEATRPQGVFCVFKGKVKIIKLGSDGKEQIIYLVKQGEILGLKSLLANEDYTTSACTLEESIICHIPKNDFMSMLETQPTLNLAITHQLCTNMELIENKVLSLSQRTVRERLALNILILHESFGIIKDNEMLIDVPLSREDLANLVGTATETLIRALSEFKKEGMVKFTGKKMAITNLMHLKKVAEVSS